MTDETLAPIAARLRATLEALPDAGSLHVTAVTSGERLVVHTVTGARFEAWTAEDPPDLSTLGRVAAAHLPRLQDEPYDLYTASGPGYAAVELRSLAGFSLLEIAVLKDGQPLRARVHQEDDLRWEAEEAGLIGEDFEDFRERNALWEGLGGSRPGGWELTVVEPGEGVPGVLGG